jgi:anti-sigma-K factor RskA
MKPTDPKLLDRLASEYVLGTLRGQARRRMARWREQLPEVDALCRSWEERLSALTLSRRPHSPPAQAWRSIAARLGFNRPSPALRWVASLALLGLLVALSSYWNSFAPPRPAGVAQISAPGQPPQWQLEYFAEPGQLHVSSANGPVLPAGHDYELWALPAGGNPVSLGLLPMRGERNRPLSEAQRLALAHSTQVAVSLEPTGGSRTGQPTGPVVFTAALRSVS